ncbi:MAG: DivIVA domain-containing protein [Acidimicrobiia bacterium]
MDVTPQELRGSEIKEAWRGYHRDEVDELLERAAVTIEGLTQQLATSSSRPAPKPVAPVTVSRDDAEMLQRTLMLAQRAADDAVNEAHAEARRLLEESEARAQALVGEAEASARRIAESERRRLESDIQDLAARRDALQSDADAIEDYARAYRERVRAAIESDLHRLGSGAIAPPKPRPVLSGVDVPAPAFADDSPAPPIEPESEPPRDHGSSGDGGRDTRAVTIDPPAPAGGVMREPGSSPVAAPPRPAETAWPPAPQAEPGPSAAAGPAWLAGKEPPSNGAPPNDALPWEQATASHEPFSSDTPMEATAVDGDSLDDDAFFASLRDVVRDDERVGPIGEEPVPFFDDVTDDRRRFRRRR